MDANQFGPNFEKSVLYLLVNDNEFCKEIKNVINLEYFSTADASFLSSLVIEYVNKYNKIPSEPVLKDLIHTSIYKNKGGVFALLDELEPVNDVVYVLNKIVEWVKWSAIDIVNGTTFDSPDEYINEITKISGLVVGEDKQHVTLLNDDSEEEESKADIIETPWKWLNEQLNGGPEVGDLGVILTVPNGGKTSILVNIARHALQLGKFVVYFTFEDGDRKIKRRLLQSICRVTREELVQKPTRINNMKRRFLSAYGGDCVIKNMRTRVDTVATAMSFVRSVEKSYGRKVDLVITDYADRFRTVQKYNEPRHALREIFEDCKFMARELEIVHWTARQSNKDGHKNNIIDIDNASESWGSTESPDIILGFGMNLEDRAMGQLLMHTAKMRDAESKQKRYLTADFETQRIYDEEELNETQNRRRKLK